VKFFPDFRFWGRALRNETRASHLGISALALLGRVGLTLTRGIGNPPLRPPTPRSIRNQRLTRPPETAHPLIRGSGRRSVGKSCVNVEKCLTNMTFLFVGLGILIFMIIVQSVW